VWSLVIILIFPILAPLLLPRMSSYSFGRTPWHPARFRFTAYSLYGTYGMRPILYFIIPNLRFPNYNCGCFNLN